MQPLSQKFTLRTKTDEIPPGCTGAGNFYVVDPRGLDFLHGLTEVVGGLLEEMLISIGKVTSALVELCLNLLPVLEETQRGNGVRIVDVAVAMVPLVPRNFPDFSDQSRYPTPSAFPAANPLIIALLDGLPVCR